MTSILSLELIFAFVMFFSGVIAGVWIKGKFK